MGGDVQLRIGEGIGAPSEVGGGRRNRRGQRCGIRQLSAVEDEDLSRSAHILDQLRRGSQRTWKKATRSGHEISPNMKLSANP